MVAHPEKREEAAQSVLPPAPRRVELLDAAGAPLGVTVTLKDEIPEPEPAGPDDTKEYAHLRYFAKSIAGWSTLVVDGEPYAFSQARALALFQRFPYMAAQIGRALNKKDHA